MFIQKTSLFFVNLVLYLGYASTLFSHVSVVEKINIKSKKPPLTQERLRKKFPYSIDSFAVTYDFSGGRFGDNLLSYFHAKWISYKYDMLLLYKPFPFADSLVLSQKEHKLEDYYYDSRENIFKKEMVRDPEFCYFRTSDLKWENPSRSTLYVVPYFPEAGCKRDYFHDINRIGWSYFDVDWKDEDFRSIALEMLRPTKDLELCYCPLDKITVAIHVRTGKGFDSKDITLMEPNLAPPLEFYYEALESLLNIYPDRELYFHVFTDDPNPKEIADTFQDYLKNLKTKSFSINYRISKNRHCLNVLEDFFSLFQFDCLIRPDSNFSRIPSLLKDYKVLIYPSELEQLGHNNFIISKIDIVRND